MWPNLHSTWLTIAITAHLPSAFKSLTHVQILRLYFPLSECQISHNALKIISSEEKKKDTEGPFVGGRK